MGVKTEGIAYGPPMGQPCWVTWNNMGPIPQLKLTWFAKNVSQCSGVIVRLVISPRKRSLMSMSGKGWGTMAEARTTGEGPRRTPEASKNIPSKVGKIRGCSCPVATFTNGEIARYRTPSRAVLLSKIAMELHPYRTLQRRSCQVMYIASCYTVSG